MKRKDNIERMKAMMEEMKSKAPAPKEAPEKKEDAAAGEEKKGKKRSKKKEENA